MAAEAHDQRGALSAKERARLPDTSRQSVRYAERTRDAAAEHALRLDGHEAKVGPGHEQRLEAVTATDEAHARSTFGERARECERRHDVSSRATSSDDDARPIPPNGHDGECAPVWVW